MTAAPVRLAIVGCGGVTRECHVPGALATDAVDVVVLVDPVVERAAAVRDLLAGAGRDPRRIRVASGLDAVTGDVEAAVVATPHRYHADVACELMGRGVSCLVEKPMALDVAECDRIAAAAAAAGALVGPAHVRRLFPASRWVSDVLAEGRLGEILAVDWREGAPYDWPLVTPSLFVPGLAGGGVTADSGPHILDLLLWWLAGDGREAAVAQYRDSSRGGAESEAVIELRIGSVAACVEMSRLRRLANTCTIVGADATLTVGIDTEAPYEVRVAGRVVEEGTVPAVAPAQEDWHMLFAEQLRNFAAAVRGTEALYVPPEDGRRVVELLGQCYARREPMLRPWDELDPL